MNKRELNLLILTVVVVGGLAAYHFLWAPSMDEADAESSQLVTGDLQSERETFESYMKILQNGADIREQYESISFTSPERIGNLSPAQTFQNQLSSLLTQRFFITNPRVEPPTYSEIKEVDDYYFVDIRFEIVGERAKVIDLLKELEALGLLIKDFRLSMMSKKSSELLKLEVQVARLVKHDATSRRRFKGRRSRSS